jgi:phage terminase large subunit
MTIAHNKAPAKLTVHRSTDRMKFKPKRWSHQNDLDALKGQNITVTLHTGHKLVVRLLDSDQFTLKVQDLSAGQHEQSVLTYFKHAIAAYGVAK